MQASCKTYKAELGAVVIRKSGARQNLGIISRSSLRHFSHSIKKLFHSLVRLVGYSAAVFMLLTNVKSGNLPGYTFPCLFGIVTTAGVNYMASDFASGGATPTISGFKYQDCGEGNTAAAVGDTALQTPAGTARVVGTPTNPSANQYRSVATIPFTGTKAIVEWGLFSASSSGTLWDRRVFSVINVGNGDSIQFTYTLTVPNGGT
jgi:hypothetical protein